MIITTLVENSTISKAYTNKHGLCIHLKTEKHSILFDLGSDDTFIKNAKKLNIDIKDVDIVIISHGHKDHGGGLKAFIDYNDKALIYISKYGFKDYYASFLKYMKFYIGLDQELKENKRIILTDEIYCINQEIKLISNIKGSLLIPTGNKDLLVKDREKFILDKFKHEQHLILKENGRSILISGCSHTGILNILQESEEKAGVKIDLIIGGMHLYNPINRKTEDLRFINELGSRLLEKDIKIYTCHCTGLKAFEVLSNILGKNIKTLKTGQVIELVNKDLSFTY
ncbi:MBL fold metallo-hydrolase [Clostridium intestinale]|uniref:Metallo-beta-lactamase n=1 Tax=Clostridium intestinale URNW TaxID=1294142 RepID=U2NSQ6_9CLOT|nr:MBL fold metallo-hydrolase [Clostridium intestinale]ERK31901.1 metallo-beta-lactamase [Clostridium intestinale URNW]